MSKRVKAQKTASNSSFFVEGTDLIKLNAGLFDAISMVADGELVLGKIHKFYVTELHLKFDSGASLVIKDIPPVLGAFIQPVDDHPKESLLMDGMTHGTLTTATGEELQVFIKIQMAGSTDIATGATEVVGPVISVFSVYTGDVLDENHPFIDVYRNQTQTSDIVADQSGFMLEATVDVAPV